MGDPDRKRIYCTDLEGPVTKNDNAAELAAAIMPDGGEFFRRVSRYDDYLAEVVNMVGYRAGDTLRLVLPFMMAHGMSSKGMHDFALEGILVVPGADDVLRSLSSKVPAYIISTSYCEYVHAVCEAIGFPDDQTFCTRVDLDDYAIPEDEVETVRELALRVLSRDPIEIPPGAEGLDDLSPEDQETVADLDEVFWEALADLSVFSIVDETRTVGGPEKAESIKRAAAFEEVEVEDVIYVGDSITDVAAFRTVREAGGLAVSFNGNRWAVEAADLAVVSERADPLLPLATAFLEGGRAALEGRDWFGGAEGTLAAWLEDVDVEAVVQRSEQVRKQVRGEVIGRLG
jgi:predicted HAD superfamily phosphohydrolase